MSRFGKRRLQYVVPFVASIVIHNGKPALLIRKITNDPEIIREIVREILQKGVFEFQGELRFKNIPNALRRLREAGLL